MCQLPEDDQEMASEDDNEGEDDDGAFWLIYLRQYRSELPPDADDYVDYDSDYEAPLDAGRGGVDVDPYSGADPHSIHSRSLTGIQVYSSQRIAVKK